MAAEFVKHSIFFTVVSFNHFQFHSFPFLLPSALKVASSFSSLSFYAAFILFQYLLF